VLRITDFGYTVAESAGLLTADGEPTKLTLLWGIIALPFLECIVATWPREERDLVQLLRVIDRDPDQASRRSTIADMLNTEISRNPTRDRKDEVKQE
jgi:hypothetical protein